MKAAIIGLPQSGKTTVFEAVTGRAAPPGESGRAHLASVQVPDERLETLTAMYKPKKTTQTAFEFVDVPGLSLQDAHGQEEMRRHLPTIRQADVMVAVVRDFEDPAVPAYRDRVDRAADLTELWEEFLFADLDAVTHRVEKLGKALKKPTKMHDEEKRELVLLQRCQECLENERPLSEVIHTSDEAKALASFGFLTEKPLVVVFNVDESRAGEPAPETPDHALAAIHMSAKTEAEIIQLDPEDRPAFLEDLGLEVVARDRLIRTVFDALGLISFLTVGPDEVRAWAIPKGTTAVDAAGKIHSDLARGFIRAEIVAYNDLIEAGDMRAAKAAGTVRQEGKPYIMQDGDITNIKFNV